MRTYAHVLEAQESVVHSVVPEPVPIIAMTRVKST